MKKLILITLIILCNHLLNAQEFECFTSPEYFENSSRVNSSYVYDLNGPIKTIRVNFHFLLKDNGTGNFTETSDGYTNRPYNGYLYADDMVKWCNQHWKTNIALRHMPVPAVPMLDKKVQYQLCGVYFHRNTSIYNSYTSYNMLNSIKENSGEVINIYVAGLDGSGGAAWNGCSGEITYVNNAYKNYRAAIDSNDTWYHSYAYKCINHEVGHLLGLPHAIQECCKQLPNPNQNCHDGIADTPTYDELLALGYLPCEWNHQLGSNNLMDYCASQTALSPMQISKMHDCIDGTKLYYRNCKYKNNSLNISSFTTSKAYIAKFVTIPSTSSIVVGNRGALFINAEEVVIDGYFEVQSGSVLSIETITSCN